MANDVTIVGPQATNQQMIAALMMAGFSNNTIISNLIKIAGWESGATPKVNAAPSESPAGYTGCKSVGVWQINYCPARDKGTIREQAANNPADLVLNARAAYLISNGGQNLNPWTTWREHNVGTSTSPPIGTGLPNPSDFVSTPFLGTTVNDPASLAAAGITITDSDPCGPRPTGATLSIFPYMMCRLQQDLKRGGQIMLGVTLIIVGLIILAKVAGDKTGITQTVKEAGLAAAAA